MAGKFGLTGAMISRSVKRVFDHRGEARQEFGSASAVLRHRGRNHVVRILNFSPSGAMVAFPTLPKIGDAVSLRMVDRGPIDGHVCWARDKKIGINFVTSLDQAR